MTDELALRDGHLREAAASVSGQAGDVEAFLRDFYRLVVTEELLEVAPAELAGAALTTRDRARSLTEGVTVGAFTPAVERDGWASGHSVIQVVGEDAPFLVDSLLEELERTGQVVHFLAHPQLLVRRDSSGELVEVAGVTTGRPDAREPEDARRESWVHVEIDRKSDPRALEKVADGVRRVLADVHATVADSERMRAEAERLRADLVADGVSAKPTLDLLEWLISGQFVFVGAARFRVGAPSDTSGPTTGEGAAEFVVGSAAGILNDAGRRELAGAQRPAGEPRESGGFVFTKSEIVSPVHRRVRLDHVAVTRVEADGAVVEHVFLGLFTAQAYAWSVTTLPFVAEKVRRVIEAAGYVPGSHLENDLVAVLESYPRDELFHDSVERLTEVATEVVHLSERRRTRLFLRVDPARRYVTGLVYLPRDRYNTQVRLRIQEILRAALGGDSIEYRTRASESSLAQVYTIVHDVDAAALLNLDVAELERRIIQTTRSWDETFMEHAAQQFGDEHAVAVLERFGAGMTAEYRAAVTPRSAVADIAVIEDLEAGATVRPLVYHLPGAPADERRMKVYSRSRISLSDLLPVLADLGLRVTDERPHLVRSSDGETFHVYDIGLTAPATWSWADGEKSSVEEFEAAFTAVWNGEIESDGLNALVLQADMSGRQVVILRALCAYLRQAGTTFSRSYVQNALLDNKGVATRLVRLFETRFDPDLFPGGAADAQRVARAAEIEAEIESMLADVASLDEDTIVRRLLSIVRATVRTNFYARERGASVALKLHPAEVQGIPAPVPAVEVWVHGPRVEGTHLRFGAVARGGLRWSDRREDFRTEVLGLVKAQMVKNALIVPTGSKGGFVAKRLPDPSDREAWMAEGVEAYKEFIAGLLDVTDNRVGDEVVAPDRVLRYDGDDPYLVVAADKGTARFSDIANGVAESYGFWLGDAFASGGSAGYDHKGMGITARGAWVSVQRHFRELGVDVQAEEFTAVGVGDMSGDVFGNGMLLSEHTRLVAAFDHRHIFVDPTPDAARSFAERRRLFELPRSSWEDFDRDVISAGGGVFPRTAKSIEVTEQMAEALGLAGPQRMAPADLVSAILRAPVDLLWNGGIGTYVKASSESHADVGDRANDAVRIDGADLRVKVVGEGGNLGFSQLGRIEAATAGVRINTDAIDNAAGVNTSDHEVNIKILLRAVEESGDLTRKQRNELLASMTDEIAEAVLQDNYEQNVLLRDTMLEGATTLGAEARYMRALEATGELDRALEFLPGDAEIEARYAAERGLELPEACVLAAYAKLDLKRRLTESDLPDEPYMDTFVTAYFPAKLTERYGDRMAGHPLRREIAVNVLANAMINCGGLTFVHRAAEETEASADRIAAAYVVAAEVFNRVGFHAQVAALDNRIDPQVQGQLDLEFRRVVDRSVRWLLTYRPRGAPIGVEIERFGEAVAHVRARVGEWLLDAQAEQHAAARSMWEERGVPADLAQDVAGLMFTFSALDIVEIAHATDAPIDEVAAVYFAAMSQVRVGELLVRVGALERDDRWDALARQALRDDLYDVANSITQVVLTTTPAGDGVERVDGWAQSHGEVLGKLDEMLRTMDELPDVGFAPVSVAVRRLRSVVRAATVPA